MWLTLSLLMASAELPGLKLERLPHVFVEPVDVQVPAGDRNRIFVAENPGRIVVIKNGVKLDTPFLDIRALTAYRPGAGLIGFAFHPDYRDNGWVYVTYARRGDVAKVVMRYTVSPPDSDQVDPDSAIPMLAPILEPGRQHLGGSLTFGPDKTLYISSGDGDANDRACAAQDGMRLNGKILRVNDDGTIPADNPFLDDPAVADEVFARGFRNPWRMSIDPIANEIWIGDVGHDRWEEVSVARLEQARGANFGWPVMEADSCFDPIGCSSSVPACGDSSLLGPIFTYPHAVERAVAGGYVYRGCAAPRWRGTYFLGDFCSGKIWTISRRAGAPPEIVDRTREFRIPGRPHVDHVVSFGENADHELFVVDWFGEVYALLPRDPPGYRDLGYSKAGISGRELRLTPCGALGEGEEMKLSVSGAAPGAEIDLFLGAGSAPRPAFGGLLVPAVPSRVMRLVADQFGEAEVTLPGGVWSSALYAQAVVKSDQALSAAFELVAPLARR
jgi:glucose/arabinose dehydrogenase